MALSSRTGSGSTGAAALAILAVVLAAATAALGALAQAGICLHRLGAVPNHDHLMMDGMAMSGSAADATCPVMFYAAFVAGGLCLLAVLWLAGMRPSGSALSRAAAALVLRTTLSVENLLDHRFLLKVANGFNTTQWNAPRRIVLRLTAPC